LKKPRPLLALLLSLALNGCQNLADYAGDHPIELNHVEAEENERLARDPELAEYLQSLNIPQDSHLHFSGGATRLKDRDGNPIGWDFTFSGRVAWPRDPRPDWVQNATHPTR
jgi:hypothetical protein